MHPVEIAATLSPWEPGLLALAVYALLVVGLMALLLALCSWLGEGKTGRDKFRPYESGIIPTGVAQLRTPVPFYLVAIFFLIFDVETAFILAWAVAFDLLGWAGWMQIACFIVLLLFGLFYVWQKGGLEWGPAASGASCNDKISC
ncbi:MAG TPA: NADH-quinone oxidoreductase subunit A [Syntrophobacteraceae bacterium]|nr:NADH-quinone oxidoreductase subunit A [Syntrophobacteraceae bacterium]HBD08482.1 NADH-quinone oxidoreductase subunit A [Syntrophobacteraceae bacterium]